MHRSDTFYSDFDVFIKDVTQELGKKGNLSANWIKGVSVVVGIGTLLPILVPLITGLLGLTGMAAIGLGAGRIAGGILSSSALISLLKKLPKSNKGFSEVQESERIKKAEIIFNEILADKNELTDYRSEIDKLADDLINGREIIY